MSILLLIDATWLMAALGLLVWGIALLIKQRARWKRALGLMIVGGLLMGARFVDALWRVIHQCVGGQPMG